MVFIHNINPVLFTLGPFSVRYYGIFFALGFLSIYLTILFAAKRKLVKNLTLDNYDGFFLYIVVGCLLGARLFHVFVYQPAYYFSNPFEIIAVWHGGLAFHGALIGVVTASILACKKYKISFFDIADLLVIPTAFALALGRIANLINGEIIGTKTDSLFCIQYQNVEGCRYPVQIYESAKNLFIGFILGFMYFSKKFKKGVLFFSFIFLYGVLRFLTNFYRDETRYFGLTEGQYFSLAMVIVAFVWFIFNRHKIFRK